MEDEKASRRSVITSPGSLLSKRMLISFFWFVLPIATGLFLLYAINSPHFPLLSGNTGNGASWGDSISGDGSLITFVSNDVHLPNGENSRQNVYVYDNRTGAAILVSANSTGEAANGDSGSQASLPAISADGGHVVFYSRSSNLVSGIKSGLFEKNLKSGAVKLVADMAGQDPFSIEAAVSGDGNYVVFTSAQGVYVHDSAADKTVRADVDAAGKTLADPVKGYYRLRPSISADGRLVAFTVYTPAFQKNSQPRSDVYVKDMQTGLAVLESTDEKGQRSQLNGSDGTISADGSRLLYLLAGSIELKDLGSGKAVSVGYGTAPSLSPDGRYVAYQTKDDSAGRPNIYLFDVQVRSNRQVVAPGGWDEPFPRMGPFAVSNNGVIVFTAATSFNGIKPEKCPFDRNHDSGGPLDIDCTNVYRRDVASGDLRMVSGTGGATVATVPEWHPPQYYNSSAQSNLAQAARAQESYRRANGRFAIEVADLKDFGFMPTEGVTIDISNATSSDYCMLARGSGGSTWYLSKSRGSPTTSACR